MVTLTPVDNHVDAPDKAVRVSATATNALAVTAPANVEVTIADDEETPGVTLVVADTEIRESDDPNMGGDQHVTTVTATQEHPSSEPTTITITPSAGLRVSGTLTIPAGETESSAAVTLTAVDNDTDAPDNELTLTATAVNTQGVEQPAGVAMTITDDEPAPTVTLDVTATSVGENGGRATMRVGLSHPSSQPTTVTLTATPVSPAVAADFTFAGSVLSIPAGGTAATSTATLTAVDNDTDAPDKTVTVSSNVVNTQGFQGNPANETLTITDNEPAPTVTLKLSSDSVGEAGGEASVTARLSHPSSEATAVTVTAVAVSPTVAADFMLAGSSLRISAGLTDSVGTVTLTAENNDVDAADKRVTVSGAAVNTQGLQGDPADVTLTITDDDTRGFAWRPPERLTMLEFDTNVFTVALTSEPTEQVTVTVTAPSGSSLAEGSDFGSLTRRLMDSVTLTFTAQTWSQPQSLVLRECRATTRTHQTDTTSIQHAAAGGDYAGLTRSYPVTLLDRDGDSVLHLTADRFRVAEGGGLQTIEVRRRRAAAR